MPVPVIMIVSMVMIVIVALVQPRRIVLLHLTDDVIAVSNVPD